MSELEVKSLQLALKAAFEHRNKLMSGLKDALKRYKAGKFTVAIFGIGGSGKTTTQVLLTEGTGAVGKDTSYFPTVTNTTKKAVNRPFVTVWDTPGQEDARVAAWDEAVASINSSKSCFIINVVSYGHSSPGELPFSYLAEQSNKPNEREVVRNYFRIERQKEISALRDLCGKIETSTTRCRFLTLVNKQDLWWTNREKVIHHYTSGIYAKILHKLAAARTKGSFSHHLKEVSLCPINLTTSDGVTLARVCAGYDIKIREFYFNHLLRELKQIVSADL